MYQPPRAQRSMQEPFLGRMMKLFLCRQSFLSKLIRTLLGHLEIFSQDLLTQKLQDQPYFRKVKQSVPILVAVIPSHYSQLYGLAFLHVILA